MTLKYKPKNFILSKNQTIIVTVLLTVLYGVLSSFVTRNDFIFLIVAVITSFSLTYLVIDCSNLQFRQLVFVSILVRLIFIATVPFLSQDFFRFIWDGQLLAQGINPYLHNVDFYFVNAKIGSIQNASVLKEGMGSLNASNFTNYPPFSQLLYACSAWISGGSVMGFVIALRLFLIGFDLLFMIYAKRLLEYLNLESRSLFWYILNPLTILEITGNLHLEGVMISFFVMSLYFMLKNRFLLSSVLFSFSVTAKLLSLIFIPFVIKYIFTKKGSTGYKNTTLFILSFIVCLGFQFLVFYDNDLVSNFTDSVGLWFNTFEFNASFYYICRWIGYEIVGWNVIKFYGMVFPILYIVFTIILFLFSKQKSIKVFNIFLLQLTVYLLFSTTIHPWYILFPLGLSVFTRFRFPILWSLLVFLSYYTYTNDEFQESTILLITQYGILIGFVLYELWKNPYGLRVEKNLTPK